MTIRLYDIVPASAGFPIYRDDKETLRFWYLPSRYLLARKNGGYAFAARLKRKAGKGFARYDFECWPEFPAYQEVLAAQSELRKQFGRDVELINHYAQHVTPPVLRPLTDFPYIETRCEYTSGNSVACRFVVPERVEPGLANFIQDNDLGWIGEVLLAVDYAKVKAHWFVSSDDYCQALMWRIYHQYPNPQIGQPGEYPKWEIYDSGGNPGLLYRMAEQLLAQRQLVLHIVNGSIARERQIEIACEAMIRARIFVRSADGGISINRWGKWEEYDSVKVEGFESDIRTRQIGLSIVLGKLPAFYFNGYDNKGEGYDSVLRYRRHQ